MKYSGEAFMTLCLTVIAAGVVITALKWPLKAALFPVIIGTPLFFMTIAQLLLSLFERKENRVKKSIMDFKFSEDVDQAIAVRRTLLTFGWITGFSLLILFLGFPIAIPLFLLLYIKLQAREGWRISLILTGLAWGFFWGLFVWLLDMPFQEGLLIKGLRALGLI